MRTFRSARHGRPEGLHYIDFFTADTFGIKTTTYSNGPSPLIGGNIRIH